MATHMFDAKGLKCPQPTLKLTTLVISLKPGDILDVVADCPTFEADVKGWCSRMKKVLISIKEVEGGAKRAQIKV